MTRSRDAIDRIRTANALGLLNVVRVLVYRASKSLGLLRMRSPVSHFERTTNFLVRDASDVGKLPGNGSSVDAAGRLLAGKYNVFGGTEVTISSQPNWLASVLDNRTGPACSEHWSRIPDFSEQAGDIKTVWELSRFAWLLVLARAALQGDDDSFLATANEWIGDWCHHNPVNQGPNWMSGQEVAIRLIHTLLADKLLRGQSPPGSGMEHFVQSHCTRIALTPGYGVAQNNNHAISEAAGLFIGGSWLERNAVPAKLIEMGIAWRREGAAALEKAISKLILPDGSFAQYSVTYHRLVLDTLAILEWWRVQHELASFSDTFCERSRRAVLWLFEIVDTTSGDAPNIGANDGALEFSLCDSGRRDFRPTVQLCAALFLGKRAYSRAGSWDEPLVWLGLKLSDSILEQHAASEFPDGGFSVIRDPATHSHAICRYPVFHFRPGHADALHVDLWQNGVNVLRDGGSFSYAAEPKWIEYFMGTESHNTCLFDARSQMPWLGRFLFADWLEAEELHPVAGDRDPFWRAAYTDYQRCRHEREVRVIDSGWAIEDRLAGPFQQAVIRWRLCPDVTWQVDRNVVQSQLAAIHVSGSSEITELCVSEGWESRHYLKKTRLPVVEIRLGAGEQSVTTRIELRRTK